MRRDIAALLRRIADALDPMPSPALPVKRCRHKNRIDVRSPLSRCYVYECLDCGERIRGEPISAGRYA